MTARAKQAANDLRDQLFEAAGWRSVVSGLPLREGTPQLAHRIAKTQSSLGKYGSEVISHPLNLVPVRDLKENDACNIGNRPVDREALAGRIIRILTGRESMPDMAEEYRELREKFAKGEKV